MVIDSSGFSKNKEQHFEWYKDYQYGVTDGFPNNPDIKAFLKNLTHVFYVENAYNFNLVYWGQQMGIKMYCQVNYEFCENLDKPYLPEPDKWLMPSHWKLDEMKTIFGEDRVMYLPPPIDPHELQTAREVNLSRKGKRKFLHIIGTPAMADRNGTGDLLNAIQLTKGDFELVVRTQHPISMSSYLDDPRVSYTQENLEKNEDLYKDFDALLLPRRWGGLSLTMNEALLSGLPVLMTDISPNKEILPSEWLSLATKKGSFFARSSIETFSVDFRAYAKNIDRFASMSDERIAVEKKRALQIGIETFSEDALRERYINLFNDGKS